MACFLSNMCGTMSSIPPAPPHTHTVGEKGKEQVMLPIFPTAWKVRHTKPEVLFVYQTLSREKSEEPENEWVDSSRQGGSEGGEML